MNENISTAMPASTATGGTTLLNMNDNNQQPFSEVGTIVTACLILPMSIFGVFVNLVTMIVIAKSKQLKSIFNQLLMSLCLSDFLSALFSPLVQYRVSWGYDDWQLNQGLCKASFAVDAWTSYVTTLHILMFAIFRLIYIRWPLKNKSVKVLHVRIIIVIIWILGFTCAFIPYFIFFEDIERDRSANGPDVTWAHCSLNPEWIPQFITYYQVTFPIFVYLPMASIMVLCPTIGIIIKRRRYKSNSSGKELSAAAKHQRKKERHAMLQLGFITGSFLMGYIPNTAHVIYTTNTQMENIQMRINEWNFYLTGYIFLRLSECLNPIFYNIASNKLRKETFQLLSCIMCRSTDPSSNSVSKSSKNVALSTIRPSGHSSTSGENKSIA